MDWINKNKITFITFGFGFIGFIFLTVSLWVSNVFFTSEYYSQEIKNNCVNQLHKTNEDLKKFFLETLNHSRLWSSNKKEFFDSRWVSISYYEHDGQQWVLKEFQPNQIFFDLYKINSASYLMNESEFNWPHPDSEQTRFFKNPYQKLNFMIIESSNYLNTKTPHLFRITIFEDQIDNLISENTACFIELFNSNGEVLKLSNKSKNNKPYYPVEKAQNNYQSIENSHFEFHSLSILKNIKASLVIQKEHFTFRSLIAHNFLSFTIIYLCLLSLLLLKFHTYFSMRIGYLKSILEKFIEKDYKHNFQIDEQDELSEIEEKLAELKDELRR